MASNNSLVIESERLILRRFRESDLEPFRAYRSDPVVARYQGWKSPYGKQLAQEFIEKMREVNPGTPGQWYQLAIEMKDSGLMIGDCAFRLRAEDPRQAEIAFTLSRKHQKQGLATEAVTALLDYLFEVLDLHRVTATCDVENASSIALLSRIGMRREAHFVENIWFKGRWGSEYCYGLLQSEWRRAQ